MPLDLGDRSRPRFVRHAVISQSDSGLPDRRVRHFIADASTVRQLRWHVLAAATPECRARRRAAKKPVRAALLLNHFPLAIARLSRMYRAVDALARAYGPWWLCNDVTRPFWQSGLPSFHRAPGPEREVDMVAIPIRAVAPCPDAVLPGTRQRGRGSRVTDPSSLR